MQHRAEEVQRRTDANAQRGLNDIFERLESALAADGRKLVFHASPDGQTIIQVIDRATGEVLVEVPSVEKRRIAEELERLRGLLLDRFG
jgi:uncharacterized FlaG/YvyC family protein